MVSEPQRIPQVIFSTSSEIDELTAHKLFVRTQLTTAQGGRHAGLCVLFLEDLREVEARVRTEKLASMGRMSAAVAHEIRNPLSAITQANALLDEEVQEPGQKRLTRMLAELDERVKRKRVKLFENMKGAVADGTHQ